MEGKYSNEIFLDGSQGLQILVFVIVLLIWNGAPHIPEQNLLPCHIHTAAVGRMNAWFKGNKKEEEQ
jgi:hypothetical protein